MNNYDYLIKELSPALPKEIAEFKVGIVGAGSIVKYGHMPAYKKAGFNITAISSRTFEKAKAAQKEYSIPYVFENPIKMVKSDLVKIVDLTFPFDAERMPIIKAAAENGKAILLQKPFAHSMEVAREIIAIGKANNVKIAVNQNARWSPYYRMVHLLKREGFFGDIYYLEHRMINNQAHQNWFYNGWYGKTDRFQVLEYGIHHIDLLRFWAECEPEVIGIKLVKRSDTSVKGDIAFSMTLGFGDAIGNILEDNSAAISVPVTSDFRVAGTEGEVIGTAVGSDMHITLYSSDESKRYELDGNWFPDGFIGTMGELMLSLEEDREPTISVEDNIKSLKIALEAYK